jgi:hypothetical protein
MIFKLMIRFGRWMITETGVYELRTRKAVKGDAIWQQWDQIKEW